MNPVAEYLRGLIRAQGPVSIASYMQIALGDPEHGYYIRADPLGARGDFITSPEISQIFGELIGLWCVQCWRDMGAPAAFALVELGPGRGTLMADALRAARIAPEFIAGARVHLIESSPVLRAKQQAVLGTNLHWHAQLDSLPEMPGLIIANEFFDALPVRQFQRTERGWTERMIGIDPGTDEFSFCLPPAPLIDVFELPPQTRHAPLGAIVEICPAAMAISGEMARRIAANGGAALIIDYGYAQSRPGDTLQAVRAHKFCDPLHDPGNADLTAHVDFAQLAAVAQSRGATVRGPAPQGEFLTRLGIRRRAAGLMRQATPQIRRQITAAVDRLTAPAQMGSLFKVMTLHHPDLPTPAGFES